MHVFELVSELGNGHFVRYEFVRDNDIDWGTRHSNGGRGFGACGSIARCDSRVSEKSACRVGVGGALLLVRRSRSLADEYGGAQWVQAFHLCIGTLGFYWQCDVSERVAGGSGIGWVALFDSGSNHEGSGFFRSPVFPNYFCVGI